MRRYKLIALLLSAGFTALAGSLYACMVGFVDPDSALGILISVNMVIVAALGGAGTLFGPLLGAMILVPLEQWTNAQFGGSGAGITYVVYGGIIILVSRFAPGGLIRIGADLLAPADPGKARPCCSRLRASSRRSAASAPSTTPTCGSTRARSSA